MCLVHNTRDTVPFHRTFHLSVFVARTVSIRITFLRRPQRSLRTLNHISLSLESASQTCLVSMKIDSRRVHRSVHFHRKRHRPWPSQGWENDDALFPSGRDVRQQMNETIVHQSRVRSIIASLADNVSTIRRSMVL